MTALVKSPVVVTSPTGSGKSTQLPRWCRGLGKVLVMEPRRVACRGLAQYVAQLEGDTLGGGVGYHVRDDARRCEGTEILFATPGIILRMMASGAVNAFQTLVIDEFHERSLDVDLALALALAQFKGHLVVMSATLDGARVAAYLDGALLEAQGRQFPVGIEYLPGEALLPDSAGLEGRVLRALKLLDGQGDVLVFLPGKGEIRRLNDVLQSSHYDVLPLHGGLSLREQNRVFSPSKRQKVILATNVAETSITVEGIAAVVDSGLVRRTRYHAGRGFLTLGPIAQDSADQRTGRAGRLGPGRALRLWSGQARLAAHTPPEIARESLLPLVLGASASGQSVETLAFLDPPADHALQDALRLATDLGALDPDGSSTQVGKKIFGLPVDPALGRILVEARGTDALHDALDLVSALGTRVPFFTRDVQDSEDPRHTGCDATALITAMRSPGGALPGVQPAALREARELRRRLVQWLDIKPGPVQKISLETLSEVVCRALPFSPHVKRRHGRRLLWSNGGTEVGLDLSSAVDAEKVDVILVLGTRAVGVDLRKRELRATFALPVTLPWLVRMGMGEERLGEVSRKKGKILIEVERHFASRVIGRYEKVPQGALARQAIAKLVARGSLFGKSHEVGRARLAAWQLYLRLKKTGFVPDAGGHLDVQPYEVWLLSRLEELGVEGVDDLSLLEADDLQPDLLPEPARTTLARDFPTQVTLANTTYDLEYDLVKRVALLNQVRGKRKDPPPTALLPKLRGFTLSWRFKSKTVVLRKR